MSAPQYYFNDAEDYNHAGQFYAAENESKRYEQFNTHTPPDISGKTRIIAVLGIHETAAPDQDGWFLSDFFAFWNIFQGITNIQNWYHCLDLDDLVAKHKRFLHGNPFAQRKVVLDSQILANSKSSRHPPQRIKAQDLKTKTKALIGSECRAAELAKENVLILMFGHGDKNNHGIVLGAGYRPTLKIGEFKSATKVFKIGISMITTSCYSGGWTCNPQLNLSTITAAGSVKPSLSWQFSGSTGRACGSMFTTAMVQKLTKVGATGKSLADDDDDEETLDYTDKQQETFAEFTRSVHEHLLKDVDRRGYEHQLTFGAQDDAWHMCWGERTGIPLSRFKERWENLEDWATDATLHPGDPLNQDPGVTDEQFAEYLHLKSEAKSKGKQVLATRSGGFERTGTVIGKRKTSGLYGGSDVALVSMVSKLAAEYLGSYRGFDDTSTDGALHNTLRRIQSGEVTDMDEIERAYSALDYRMTAMSTADKYVQMMDIPPPKGQLCCEYDTYHTMNEVGKDKFSTIFRLILDRRILFPDPTPNQGRFFAKGNHYLIAAFHHANTYKDIIVKKLDALAATLDQALEQEKEVVKRDPEVTTKRRKLFQSFGLDLGSISPRKRLSRGQSFVQ